MTMHWMRWSLASCTLGLLAACGGGMQADTAAPQAMHPPLAAVAQLAPGAAPTTPSRESLPPPRPLQASPGQGRDGGYVVDASSREQVRLFYRTVFASSEGVAAGWSGNVATCNAGDTTADFKAAVLRRINWYRALAGLPTVQFDPVFSSSAQQAALIMDANNALSHTPPAHWSCYNDTGAAAAAKSNLHLRSGPLAIDDYMRDFGAGTNAGVGHRRWLLYPQTQLMGTGDTDGGANALWVFDSNMFGTRPPVRDSFVAWPNKGYVPYQVVPGRWSFSHPGANMAQATVQMTRSGVPIPVQLEPVADGYGEPTIVWLPDGGTDMTRWSAPAGDLAYTVTVSNVLIDGAPRSFSYQVVVFDPEQSSAGDSALAISGPATLAQGVPGVFSVAPQPGATGYQWRTRTATPWTFEDGAESGAGNFTLSPAATYDFVSAGVASSGVKAFHFTHGNSLDQTLQLNQPVMLDANASVQFDSRLGWAMNGQQARLELSTDDGLSWTTVFTQAGTGTAGEGGFTTRTVSLAAYANAVVLLRWRYVLVDGSFYPQTSDGVGWYVDAIRLSGTRAVGGGGAALSTPGNTLELAGTGAAVILQARAGMYGAYAGWGPAYAIGVHAMSTTDCLLGWAERTYPELFPAGPANAQWNGYTYRFYPSTGHYVGVLSTDEHAYYMLAPGTTPVDAGAVSSLKVTAGCQ